MVRFWSQAISMALSNTFAFLGFHSLPRLIVSFVIFVLAMFLLWLSGASQQVTNELTWLKYIFMAGGIIFLPTFLFNLICAPYRLWEKEILRANEAEDKIKPRISLEGIVQQEISVNAVCIRVRNLGTEPLTNCSGLLRRMFIDHDGQLVYDPEIPSHSLRWSSRYAPANSIAFTVLTEAEIKVIDVPRPRASFPAPTSTIIPSDYYPLGDNPRVFEVEVAAENSASVKGYFRLSYEPLVFEDVSKTIDLPTSDTEDSQS